MVVCSGGGELYLAVISSHGAGGGGGGGVELVETKKICREQVSPV